MSFEIDPVSVPQLLVARTDEVPEPANLDDRRWTESDPTGVDLYWNGDEAPLNHRFAARCLWSPRHFGVLFEAAQTEPPVASSEPVLDRKTIGLWDRDVCEVFLARGGGESGEYLEFEVAPTGEWLDLAISAAADGRKTDWHFESGMECAASVGPGKVIMAVRIPWEAFGERPDAGSIWRGNLFRAVGEGDLRGYLAWSPTLTEEPNFHVPERFGKFIFA